MRPRTEFTIKPAVLSCIDINLIWDLNSPAEFFGDCQDLGFVRFQGVASQDRKAVARQLCASVVVVRVVQPAIVEDVGGGIPSRLVLSDLHDDP